VARPRKRPGARAKERAERRESCEAFRLFREQRAALLAEYGRLVDAGGCCPICGRPLVDPSRILSVSVPSPLGIVHEACA
jgi:DNA repair exonuclease SbcCD ATPase subunit